MYAYMHTYISVFAPDVRARFGGETVVARLQKKRGALATANAAKKGKARAGARRTSTLPRLRARFLKAGLVWFWMVLWE